MACLILCFMVVLVDIFMTYTPFGLKVPQLRQQGPEEKANGPILSHVFGTSTCWFIG